jgi:uncharacterized protein YoxC
MIDTIEKLLQDYVSYSFMEHTIDKDTMNRLTEDVNNYVAKLKELKLLGIADVSESFCDIEKGTRCGDSFPDYKDGKCRNCSGQAN